MVENRHDYENLGVFQQYPYTNRWGIPQLKGCFDIPTDVVFKNSEFCTRIKDCEERKNTWVMFYEWDWKFMRYWQYPKRYAKFLETFGGVITPQFSVYLDAPPATQLYSVYRSRWLGAYWESLGIKVIPDVCWGDEKSWDFCFSGIPKNSIISIGGQFGSEPSVAVDYYWDTGFEKMCDIIDPIAILYYGAKKDKPITSRKIIQIGS